MSRRSMRGKQRSRGAMRTGTSCSATSPSISSTTHKVTGAISISGGWTSSCRVAIRSSTASAATWSKDATSSCRPKYCRPPMGKEAMSRLFLGFDEHGEVFDRETLVYRKVSEGYKAQVSQLHRLYRDNALASKGIVETTLRDDGDLEHRRLVTTYPYEWPANMYKDAVLFHLGLFVELDKAGLTLKDALPNNVLFEHTSPVFVDFLSLVPADRLKDSAWLGAAGYADARFA